MRKLQVKEVKNLSKSQNTVPQGGTINWFHQPILRRDASELPFLRGQVSLRGAFPTPATLSDGPGLHGVDLCGVIPATCQGSREGMEDGLQSAGNSECSSSRERPFLRFRLWTWFPGTLPQLTPRISAISLSGGKPGLVVRAQRCPNSGHRVCPRAEGSPLLCGVPNVPKELHSPLMCGGRLVA